MAVRLQYNSFSPLSSFESWLPQKPSRSCLSTRMAADSDFPMLHLGNVWWKFPVRHAPIKTQNYNLRWHRLGECDKCCPACSKSRKTSHLFCSASTDDGVAVNGNPQASISGGVQDKRVKHNHPLQSGDSSDGLVQSLHDAARIFELAIREQKISSKTSWFPAALLGMDRLAWVKALSYQASVYSLLQAAIEISSHGDGSDRDINVFVQRSLFSLSSPLEIAIREKLSAKQPDAYEWFASAHVRAAVTTFFNYFEDDHHVISAAAVGNKQMSFSSVNRSDVSPLLLALSCTAAITKLGPTKVSCAQFFSMIPDTTGRLMDMLVDFIHIRQAYVSMKDIGLQREFLVHFGSRAASCRVKNDRGTEEAVFWVELVQKQLQKAIDREKIWSRLTTSESIEVLEKDLAIIGFFIALGRSSKSFLSINGFDVIDDHVEGLLRYLIGGSVLYYPQLSSLSSYQLYVEVVCEELDWLPFYPGSKGILKQPYSHQNRKDVSPNLQAVPQVLDVCSHWMQSFIKYSEWLEDLSNVKAARFLSKGHVKLMDCMKEQGILKSKPSGNDAKGSTEKAALGTSILTEREPVYLDKALASVEEALIKLEGLLREFHVSSSNCGKEHLKAACSDLEKIRRLKKEAEFLEASFRAKATCLQQEDDVSLRESSRSGSLQFLKGDTKRNASNFPDKSNRVAQNLGLWSFLSYFSRRMPDHSSSAMDGNVDEHFKTSNMAINDSELNDIHRFENLRKELIELEVRVQKCAVQSEHEKDIKAADDSSLQLIQIQKRNDVIGRSLDKLKVVSLDVLQGTQLLAVDVVAAMGLLRRVLTGDELTEKEKQALRRTLSDLASVVPISVLMLLPVTAVGHAAMLAAIQRYVPALIPSTYGSDRLDLLRLLEKVKELETSDVDADGEMEEAA